MTERDTGIYSGVATPPVRPSIYLSV